MRLSGFTRRSGPTSLLIVCVPTVIMLAAVTFGVPLTNPEMAPNISVECRLVRGDQLAREWGFAADVAKSSAVYAVGFVRNNSKRMAYVKLRIDAKKSIPGGDRNASVDMISPNNHGGEPFLIRLSNRVNDSVDVSLVRPAITVLELKEK